MEINRHHTVFMRRNYTTQVERAFRNHQGLIVPIFIPIHNELHANVEAPQKPSRDSMLGALAMLEDLTVAQLSDHVGVIERVGEFMDARNQKLGECLLRQAPLIREGLYR